MKTYSKFKKFSKFLMLFASISMVFSTLYLIPELNISASAAKDKAKRVNPNNQLLSSRDPNLLVDNKGLFAMRVESHLPKYFYLSSIDETDLSEKIYTEPGTGITFQKNNADCEVLEPQTKQCYRLDANYDWPYPSIAQPESIDWSFIKYIRSVADQMSDWSGNAEEVVTRATLLAAVSIIEEKYTNAVYEFQLAESSRNNVYVATQLNSPRTLYVSGVKLSAVTSPTYPADETLVKTESNCSTFGLSSPCYSMKLNAEWPNAITTAPFTPDWALLNEAYGKLRGRRDNPFGESLVLQSMELYQNAASSNPNISRMYYINGDAANFTIYAKDLSEAAQGVSKIKNKGNIKVCEPLGVDTCWYMRSGEDWTVSPPSVDTEEGYTADFAFLTEVLQSAESSNDVKALPLIKKILSEYINDAFENWQDVRFNLLDNPKTITIRNQAFFDVLNEELPNIDAAQEKYVTFNRSPNNKDQIVLQFPEVYPEAKKDSVWYKSVVFLLGSILPAWDTIGIDMGNYRQALEISLQKYMSVAERDTQTVGSLTAKYPKDIIVDNPAYTGSEFIFDAEINKELFIQPTSGYQTKVYIKPTVKSDKDIYIKLPNNALTYSQDKISFSWKDVKEGFYVSGANNVYTPVASDAEAYNRDFPQEYKMSIITYTADDKVKDRVDLTFQTVTDSAVTGITIDNTANPYFNIKGPGFVRQGDKADFSITVKNSGITANKPEVKKVVLYYCTGSGNDADTSDGANCQFKKDGTSYDAIKDVYATKELIDANPNKGWKLLEFKDNVANITYSLDTTNSAVGVHCLRVKGYKNAALKPEDNGYIDTPAGIGTSKPGALIAENITVTTGKEPVAKNISRTSPGTRYGNLIKFTLGTIGETGTSLRTIPELANRIANIIISILGIVAFFVIVIAGFMYMTAGGNAEQAGKAKNAILYALFGIVLATLSYGIMFNVVRMLNSIFGSGGGGSSTAGYTFKNLLPANPTEIGLSEVMEVLKTAIRFALDLAGLIGFIMILYASLLYVLSVGDENKATTAKKTLIWSVAGTAFLSASGFIIDYISRSLS